MVNKEVVLTVGPGLADPQGLHWLLTGELRLAAKTMAQVHKFHKNITWVLFFSITLFQIFIPTCDNVPDWFDEGGEGWNVRLPVLPHWLPDDEATGQPEGQIRFLKQKRRFSSKRGIAPDIKAP